MLTRKQQALFLALVENYGMDGIANGLDLCIEMLFYLEEDSFDRVKIQTVVTLLRDIVVMLREKE